MTTLKKLLENHLVIDIRFKEYEKILIILKNKDSKKQESKWINKNYFKRNYPNTSKFYNL